MRSLDEIVCKNSFRNRTLLNFVVVETLLIPLLSLAAQPGESRRIFNREIVQ